MWPCRAATRYKVTMHDAIQFICVVYMGSRMARLICLTGRLANVCNGMVDPNPWKRSGRKYFQRDFYTSSKSSPSLWVAGCTKYHTCWRYFCRPV